jgi:hypothetical protein
MQEKRQYSLEMKTVSAIIEGNFKDFVVKVLGIWLNTFIKDSYLILAIAGGMLIFHVTLIFYIFPLTHRYHIAVLTLLAHPNAHHVSTLFGFSNMYVSGWDYK